MSRIGKLPIPLPKGVKLDVGDGQVTVTGPKGVVVCPVQEGITCTVEGDTATIERRDDSRQQRAFHGLTRALIANGVKGTSEGWKKDLEIHGVGYRAELKKGSVEFALGYSHPIVYEIPDGVTVEVEKQTKLTVAGIDRQKVGQVAAEIRALRPPEPYKGKGVRYTTERIVRKAGKAGVGAGA